MSILTDRQENICCLTPKTTDVTHWFIHVQTLSDSTPLIKPLTCSINLFIEGSLISDKALFCLRALFGASQIHSYEDGLFD